MNLQKTFEKSENAAVLMFVSVAIAAHYALLWLFDIV